MFIRPFLTLSLAVAVALMASSTEAANKPAKSTPAKKSAKKGHTHSGVVESASSGSLTIKEHSSQKKGKSKGKGKGKGASGKTETFTITGQTKIEGGKLKKGEHVVVHAKGKVAEKVQVVHQKQKKKAKKKKK